MHKKIRTAILLTNLGGPDQISSVKGFLFNLFYDKHIIQLSNPWRFLLAKIIAASRNKTSQEIYKQIGGRSPIVEQTLKQAEALNTELASKLESYKIFVAMRHWHPLISSVVAQIKEYQPEEIILVPLYPQFSTSTTLSAQEELQRIVKKYQMNSTIKTICCYPINSGFINGYIDEMKAYLNNLQETIFLFSAHGLPQKFIEQGDPYQWQVETTVSAIVQSLEIENLNWKISYQSRVGPLKWIGPDTQDEITAAAIRKKNIVVIPISFVSEHVETLVELDIEYARIAHDYNVTYRRVPTIGINRLFIAGLAEMVIRAAVNNNNFTSCYSGRGCPQQFTKCIFKDD